MHIPTASEVISGSLDCTHVALSDTSHYTGADVVVDRMSSLVQSTHMLKQLLRISCAAGKCVVGMLRLKECTAQSQPTGTWARELWAAAVHCCGYVQNTNDLSAYCGAVFAKWLARAKLLCLHPSTTEGTNFRATADKLGLAISNVLKPWSQNASTTASSAGSLLRSLCINFCSKS